MFLGKGCYNTLSEVKLSLIASSNVESTLILIVKFSAAEWGYICWYLNLVERNFLGEELDL
jgi:hypothetical protein